MSSTLRQEYIKGDRDCSDKEDGECHHPVMLRSLESQYDRYCLILLISRW
jgi:hypothetical protein